MNTQKSLEFSDQPRYAYRSHVTRYFMLNECNIIDNRWFNLTYVLDRMVDFCHLDPKLDYIKSILDSKELEKAIGKKLKRNELNIISKVSLKNYGVDPEIHNLIEFLVGMSFQFCIFNPVTVQTIQKSYLAYGLNSYLINCIAALMLPKYLLLRGILKPLPLKDNIFYIKSLYLLTCSSTSKSEIALGAIYLFFFETNYGNVWAALVHFGLAKSSCLELRLNMLDADNQIYLNNSNNIDICEKRNAWWCIVGVETIMSILYNFPISVQSDPEKCHIPHHLLNFSPGPYPIDQNIDYSFQTVYSPSIYEKVPHFNYISISIWLTEVIVLVYREMKAFYKSSKDIEYRAKLLSNLDEKFEQLVIKNSKLFNLLEYESNLKIKPSTYANASALFIVITFNAFIMFYYESISMAYLDLKCFKHAKKYKLKMKTIARSLFSFIIKTMKLKNYPDPEIDLTQYYISSQVISDIFVSIMKLFTPITTVEDRDQAQFILEFLSELSLYFPMSQLYADWCASQVKTNCMFNYCDDIRVISQKGVLKILEKSLNKQFFYQ